MVALEVMLSYSDLRQCDSRQWQCDSKGLVK